MSQRLSVNVNDETAQALSDYANKRGVTVTEAVRRAVSMQKFFEDVWLDGHDVFIRKGDRETEVVIL